MDPIGTNDALVGAAVIAVSQEEREVTIVPGGDEMEIVGVSGPETVLVGVNDPDVNAEGVELNNVLDATADEFEAVGID